MNSDENRCQPLGGGLEPGLSPRGDLSPPQRVFDSKDGTRSSQGILLGGKPRHTAPLDVYAELGHLFVGRDPAPLAAGKRRFSLIDGRKDFRPAPLALLPKRNCFLITPRAGVRADAAARHPPRAHARAHAGGSAWHAPAIPRRAESRAAYPRQPRAHWRTRSSGRQYPPAYPGRAWK